MWYVAPVTHGVGDVPSQPDGVEQLRNAVLAFECRPCVHGAGAPASPRRLWHSRSLQIFQFAADAADTCLLKTRSRSQMNWFLCSCKVATAYNH